jgi:hypothetical protein
LGRIGGIVCIVRREKERDMTEKTAVATVKYKMYGKIDFEKKFETVKAAKGFFWGYVVKTPNITGELIIN